MRGMLDTVPTYELQQHGVTQREAYGYARLPQCLTLCVCGAPLWPTVSIPPCRVARSSIVPASRTATRDDNCVIDGTFFASAPSRPPTTRDSLERWIDPLVDCIFSFALAPTFPRSILPELKRLFARIRSDERLPGDGAESEPGPLPASPRLLMARQGTRQCRAVCCYDAR